MGFVVHLHELIDAHMSIFLSCREVYMAQQFLNRSQIRAAVEEMRGECMANGVGADLRGDAALQ